MARPGVAAPLAWRLLLAACGCHGASGPPPRTAAAIATSGPGAGLAAADVVVHVEDDGKTFDLAGGSLVTFKLASNGGTGAIWTPADADPAVLAQLGDRASEVESTAPGAPKVDVYRFVAQRAGSTAVEMNLQRPWTKNAPPARSIHVLVNVH